VAEQLRTWRHRHDYHEVWEGGGHPRGWVPLGIRKLDCGCFVDDFSDGVIWEPCMAHEGEGHMSAISDQDGMHVARCLVVVCPWQETWMYETDAVGAAQKHWRETRDS
jgi:hypothetical protein